MSAKDDDSAACRAEAEAVLRELAAVFGNLAVPAARSAEAGGGALPDVHEMYRTLVEQIPAVVFMAHLDRGTRRTCSCARSTTA